VLLVWRMCILGQVIDCFFSGLELFKELGLFSLTKIKGQRRLFCRNSIQHFRIRVSWFNLRIGVGLIFWLYDLIYSLIFLTENHHVEVMRIIHLRTNSIKKISMIDQVFKNYHQRYKFESHLHRPLYLICSKTTKVHIVLDTLKRNFIHQFYITRTVNWLSSPGYMQCLSIYITKFDLIFED